MISSATHTGDSELEPDMIWTECHLDRWGGEVREGLCSVHLHEFLHPPDGSSVPVCVSVLCFVTK